MANLLLTGSSGYMGEALIPELLRRGNVVRALVRRGSESKLPGGAKPVIGDALSADSLCNALGDADVLVHLVGAAHPSPAKHPAPAMKSYIHVRMMPEELILEAGINATILRPWYVLGPRHWCPWSCCRCTGSWNAFPLRGRALAGLAL